MSTNNPIWLNQIKDIANKENIASMAMHSKALISACLENMIQICEVMEKEYKDLGMTEEMDVSIQDSVILTALTTLTAMLVAKMSSGVKSEETLIRNLSTWIKFEVPNYRVEIDE